MKVRLKLRPILIFCIFAALGTSNVAAAGQTVPAGYKILDITLSPDHRYGVTVPDLNGPVAELVGIEGGVVSGVFNLESSDVGASDRRPRHEENYHEV
jgi:hypothetical protein